MFHFLVVFLPQLYYTYRSTFVYCNNRYGEPTLCPSKSITENTITAALTTESVPEVFVLNVIKPLCDNVGK